MMTSLEQLQIGLGDKWFMYKSDSKLLQLCGMGGLVVSALDFHTGYRGFESRWGRDHF